MAEPVLDQPRVVAGIGQGVGAGVAQHVGMDPERGNLSVWSRLLSTETVACDYCGSTPPRFQFRRAAPAAPSAPLRFGMASQNPTHQITVVRVRNGRTR